MKVQQEIIEPDYTAIEMNGFKNHFYHWHKRMEMIYMNNGQCVLEIANNKYTLNKGDVAFIHSGEIHLLSSDYNGSISAYICTFNPSVLQHIKTDIVYIKNYISENDMKKSGLTEEIKNLFIEIFSENKNNLKLSASVILSDLIRLFSLLARNFENNDMMKNKSYSNYEAFQSAIDYILENYTDNITLKSLSERISYCPSYVSTMFVSYTGVNFKTYLDTIRVKRAVDMLKNSTDKISQIAFNCGFENLKTFNNTFKRITHRAPGEFRKTNI